jgi:hypothetical protein
LGGAAVIVIANVVLNNVKRNITKYLSDRGATNIDIKYEWGTYDGNTLTVVSTNRSEKVTTNHCENVLRASTRRE